MFKTDTGYMGLAHRSVEVGDKVYMLMGGDTPVVLRPLGDRFLGFGGVCYVNGIMDEEMLELRKQRRKAWIGVVISLRYGLISWATDLAIRY
jgi:hypothetical protein